MNTEKVNLSKIDLNELPQKEAVYAIFAESKDTGLPINCRYVGETDNLQERTVSHFSESEPNECLREFMQSDKTKIMVYESLPYSTKEERLAKEQEWIEKNNPECNEK